MASKNRYFGRKYRLHIDCNGFSKDYNSDETDTPMDIKFDVSYANGQMAREGTVSVLGLNRETIQNILPLSADKRGEEM